MITEGVWWLSVYFMVGLFVVLLLSLVFAPVGAVICAVIAKHRGLDTGRYVAAGFVYSALLFVPWIYLVAIMLNRRLSPIDVALGYLAVYATWIMTSITFGALLSGLLPGQGRPLSIDLGIILLLVNIATLVFSVVRLFSESRWSRIDPQDFEPFESMRYLAPFILTIFWAIFTPGAFIAIGKSLEYY